MERGTCVSKVTELDFSLGEDDFHIAVKRIFARDPLFTLITYLEQILNSNFDESTYESSEFLLKIEPTKTGGFKYVLNEKIEYRSTLLISKSTRTNS